MEYAHIWYSFLKQKCLFTTLGTKYKVILIIVVAMATEIEGKVKYWQILRQSLVTMVTKTIDFEIPSHGTQVEQQFDSSYVFLY